MFCISNKKTNIYKRVNNKFIIKTNFLSIRTLFKKYIDVYFYFRVHNFGGYEFMQKSKIYYALLIFYESSYPKHEFAHKR